MKLFISLLQALKPNHSRPTSKLPRYAQTKSVPQTPKLPNKGLFNRCRIKSIVLFALSLSSCGVTPKSPIEPEKQWQKYTQALPLDPFSRANKHQHQIDPLPPTRFSKPVPSDWVSLSEQEIHDELEGSSTSDTYLPLKHEETIRVQRLLDQMYDQLTATAPDRFQSNDGLFQIPRPVVRIRQSPSINAAVIKLGVCRGAEIFLGKKQINNVTKAAENLIASIDFRGRIAIFERHEIACIDRLNQKSPASDIAHSLEDDIAKERCAWKQTSQGLEIEDTCIPKDADLPTKVSGIHMTTTTNLFVITTGALNQFAEEKDLKFTLAHELAHYLYAHGSLIKSGYQFFYKQNRSNYAAPKPIPETSLNLIGEKAVKLPSFRTQPIEGQKYHSEMFAYFREAMKRLIQPTCSNRDAPCFSPCEDLIKVSTDSRQFSDFGQFPQADLSIQSLELYWRYEKHFTLCAKSIALQDQDTPLAKGAVSRKTASSIYWNAEPAQKTCLYDLAMEMNQRLFKKEEDQNSLLAEALEARVGYFTTEEEADNLALEWSKNFGIQPDEAFKYWIDYAFTLKGKEQNAKLSFGFNRCAQFFETNTDQIYQDQGPLVPIGSYSDPHHSLCYRAYRTLKRLDARYQVRLDPRVIQDAVSRP